MAVVAIIWSVNVVINFAMYAASVGHWNIFVIIRMANLLIFKLGNAVIFYVNGALALVRVLIAIAANLEHANT